MKDFFVLILSSMRWQWNTDLILQMNVSGNVVELMTSFILKLPADTLDLLKIASSIGNRFSKRNLSVIKQISEKNVENLLNLSVTEGLIIPSSIQNINLHTTEYNRLFIH